MKRLLPAIFVFSAFCGGCASTAARQAPVASIEPAPKQDARALLTLDEIQPVPSLPITRPATRAVAPVEALALYARARDAMFDHQLLAAVGFLQQAIAVDPDSYELYRALGETLLNQYQHPTPQSVAALEQALALRPGDVRLRALLASQYVALNKLDRAVLQLRLAVKSEEYGRDSVTAASIDLLLAHLLQAQGYDRAALDQYGKFLDRLKDPDYALRSDPEFGALASDPSSIWINVGELYERQGRWSDALGAYQRPADEEPSNFGLQSRIVRMLHDLGRQDDAVGKAAEIIVRFRASRDSIELMRSIFRGALTDDEAIGALSRLHQRKPDDRAVLLALAEMLKDQKRFADAERLLSDAATRRPDDDEIARQLMELDVQTDDVTAAARALVLHLAARPDSLGEYQSVWDELRRPMRTHSLRLSNLQTMDVPPWARAARLYMISQLADLWRRDALTRSSLEQAVRVDPPFPPAYRNLASDDWLRPDWDNAQKQTATDELASAAVARGNAALAAEVRGIADARAGNMVAAVDQLAQAIELGETSPEVLISYADALHRRKQDAKAEQLLWKLVAGRPADGNAWAYLYNLYEAEQSPQQARDVLQRWLAADPGSVDAWVGLARNDRESGDVANAEAILLSLFAEHSDNENVIDELLVLYRDGGRMNRFIALLEDEYSRHPANRAVAEWLVEVYASRGHASDADRVIERTRAAVGKDPDLLYQIAHLYGEINEQEQMEDVLQQVIALDPTQAGASNDLGYDWADRGVNLTRAESLIRVAVAAEPDNQSFLDSMGWVLYKQGKFALAAEYMKDAIGPAALPDPVVLDHFGDILYRLGKPADAVKQWERAVKRVDEESRSGRSDLSQLRLQLVGKIDEEKAGRSVSVAPLPAVHPVVQK